MNLALKQNPDEKIVPYKKRASHYNIAVIDDDPDFRRIMEVYEPSNNVSITCYPAIRALPKLRQINNFDALLIDYYLESYTGVQISQYIQSFFPNVPVILISGGFLDENEEEWPDVIKGFVPKGLGPEGIIREALRFIK